MNVVEGQEKFEAFYIANFHKMCFKQAEFKECKHADCKLVYSLGFNAFHEQLKEGQCVVEPKKKIVKRKVEVVESDDEEEETMIMKKMRAIIPKVYQFMNSKTQNKCKFSNVIYVGNTLQYGDEFTLELKCDGIEILRGTSFIPLGFKVDNTSELDMRFKPDEKFGSNFNFFFDWKNGGVVFNSYAANFYEGPIGTLSYVGYQNESSPHDLTFYHVIFKNWKNATHPLRNDVEENVKKMFKNLNCLEVEIKNSWLYNDLQKVDYEYIINNTNALAANDPKIDKDKIMFNFETKKEWENFIKTAYGPDEVFTIFEEIRESMKNNKGFWFATQKCNKSLIDYYIANYEKAYVQKDRLLTFFESSDEFNFNVDVIKCQGMFKYTLQEEMCESYILIKPYGMQKEFFELITTAIERFKIVDLRITDKITEEEFANLYGNCMNRPYGFEWKSYMFSGPVIHAKIQLRKSDFKDLRLSMVQARALSKIIWTRNIVHCATDEEEAKQNIRDNFKISQIN